MWKCSQIVMVGNSPFLAIINMSPLDIHMLTASAPVDGQRGTVEAPFANVGQRQLHLCRRKTKFLLEENTYDMEKTYVNLTGLQHLHFFVHIVWWSLFCMFWNVIIKVGFLFVTGG